MFIDFLIDVFEKSRNEEAIIWKDKTYSYKWLLERLNYWQEQMDCQGIKPGTVSILEADFSPNSVALLLALIERQCIVVPLTNSVGPQKSDFIQVAQGELRLTIDQNDRYKATRLSSTSNHQLYRELRNRNHPGLVLFSSGSSGQSKAAVHDFSNLLKKYHTRRRNLRTLTFLLFDHIGGIDTLFYALSNGSCVVTVDNRSPDAICHAIEKYKVEVLPVSPTFLSLLLLSDDYSIYDLSSLKYVTYGTEVMPEMTLKKCAEILPHAILLQKYGTTEVGTLRSKSRSSDSLWVKVGGEDFETRVVNGILQIKARSAMLGYLNAPSPFTDDGWFDTGDTVEVDGDYIRILGRQSEIINVGGEKVYPAEVESVIQQMDNVAEVIVGGEKNSITGNIVVAQVRLVQNEDHQAFRSRLRKFCQQRLQNYKVPVRIIITDHVLHSDRFKKTRNFRQE